MLIIIIAALIAYLFGSLSSAIIVCKMMGFPDPRTQGSKNPGATNVLRFGGKKAAVITLLGDMLKGLIPILIAKWIGIEPLGVAVVAFAALLGHLYPIFFRFEGGKGVATFLGVMLALSWPTGLLWIITWLIIIIAFRYVSLSSLVASVLAPFYIWYFTEERAYAISLALISILIVYRHRSNITKLIAGTENKLRG